jgi:hypothetical protein
MSWKDITFQFGDRCLANRFFRAAYTPDFAPLHDALVSFVVNYKKLVVAPYLTSILIEGYVLVFLDQTTFQRKKK